MHRLHRSGLKVTGPRLAILAALETDESHPTAERVFATLKPDHPSLSLSTVYKTLDAFTRAGLCRRLAGDGALQRYDGIPGAHHHARCRDCGAIFDVPASAYAAPEGPGTLPPELTVLAVRIEFDVLCATCLNADSRGTACTTAGRPPFPKPTQTEV